MRRPVRRPDSQSGFTLVELLLAISILGIGCLTVVGGMMTSIQVSDLGRRQAEGQVGVRGYAEAVAGDGYLPCSIATLQYPAAGFTPPSGFAATMTVEVWTTTTTPDSFQPCGGAFPDTGLQRVTLRLATTDGRGSESVAIAKRTTP